MTPDHQLARATAEKIASDLSPHPLPNMTTAWAALILASYHERDRAATAMGGETLRTDTRLVKIPSSTINDNPVILDLVGIGNVVPVDFARTLERELIAKCKQLSDQVEQVMVANRTLIALKEINREVVAERDGLKAELHGSTLDKPKH